MANKPIKIVKFSYENDEFPMPKKNGFSHLHDYFPWKKCEGLPEVFPVNMVIFPGFWFVLVQIHPESEMKAGPAAEVIPTPTPAMRRPKISILRGKKKVAEFWGNGI